MGFLKGLINRGMFPRSGESSSYDLLSFPQQIVIPMLRSSGSDSSSNSGKANGISAVFLPVDEQHQLLQLLATQRSVLKLLGTKLQHRQQQQQAGKLLAGALQQLYGVQSEAAERLRRQFEQEDGSSSTYCCGNSCCCCCLYTARQEPLPLTDGCWCGRRNMAASGAAAGHVTSSNSSVPATGHDSVAEQVAATAGGGIIASSQLLQAARSAVESIKAAAEAACCPFLLVYAHGNGTDLQDLVLRLQQTQKKTGTAILAFDYPGYGLSQGNLAAAGTVAAAALLAGGAASRAVTAAAGTACALRISAAQLHSAKS